MTLEFLNATLDCLPEEISNNDDIPYFLNKLQEDYQRYLHPNYLDDLSSWSILRDDSNLVIMNIWYQLNAMPKENWNASSYETDKIWMDLREKATEVKKTFTIDIAMNAIYDWDESVLDYTTYLKGVSEFLESDLRVNRVEVEVMLQRCNPEEDGWKMQSIMTLSQIMTDDVQILRDEMEKLRIDIDQILKQEG